MSLDMFFKPRSIAIIGASSHPLSIPNRIMMNLMENGFKGPIYPVHPRHPFIKNFPAYKTIEDVPGDVDLAHIIVKNALVPEIVRQCGRKGVKGVIINSSGFKEIGEKGIALEQEVIKAGKESGVRIWGPNCQGCMNSDPDNPLYANFTFAKMAQGHISICAQGGGVAELINNHLAEMGVGFRMYASNGNACDVSIPEIISYWNKDPGTRCIVLHAESFADPAEFLSVLKDVDKPVLALKSGTTEIGARAVASHTGGLMEGDRATDLIFDKAGVLRFRTAQDLCEAAIAFASSEKAPKGKRVAMLTNTGSLAIMASDEAVPLGIEMPDPAEKTRQTLKDSLMGIASLHNPVDMMATAGAEHFGAAAKALLDDDNFDLLLITMVTPFFVDTEAVAHEIVKVASDTDKPVLMEVLTNSNWESTLKILRDGGLPTYYFPESAARSVAALCKFAEIRGREKQDPRVFDVDRSEAEKHIKIHDEDGWIGADAAMSLLRAYGVPVVEQISVKNADEALKAAKNLGYPVVLKGEAEGLVHKSDEGAVLVGIQNDEELRAAIDKMTNSLNSYSSVTFLLQKQIGSGTELLIGATEVTGLGKSVAFGLGGVFVEVMKDVSFGLAPLTDAEADTMIRSIKGFPILEGVRGSAPVDLKILREIIQRIGQLVTDFPQIRELDLNPVIASEAGIVAVDARIRV